MAKRTIKKQVVWGVVLGAAVLVGLALWYFLQPMQRVQAISCERVTPGTVGSCARVIQTYSRTGLFDKYEVEFTPTDDGEFHGGERYILQPLDSRCGLEFAAGNWTAEAFIITIQSDSTVTCKIDRSVIGSWL